MATSRIANHPTEDSCLPRRDRDGRNSRSKSACPERSRTRFLIRDGGKSIVTIHPSLLLRLTDRSEAKREYDLFVRDLRVAVKGSGADDVEKRDNIHQADD